MGAVYMECSAKERIGVDDIFDAAIILATGEHEDGHNDHAYGGAIKQSKARRKKFKKTCKIL